MYVFHRGGGVFESKTGYTFVFYEGKVIIREIKDQGVSRRLLDSNTFAMDLPNQLVKNYNFWMRVNGNKDALDIELRPISSDGELESTVTVPIHRYKILLDTEMKGKVVDSVSNRTMLNLNGPRSEQKPCHSMAACSTKRIQPVHRVASTSFTRRNKDWCFRRHSDCFT